MKTKLLNRLYSVESTDDDHRGDFTPLAETKIHVHNVLSLRRDRMKGLQRTIILCIICVCALLSCYATHFTEDVNSHMEASSQEEDFQKQSYHVPGGSQKRDIQPVLLFGYMRGGSSWVGGLFDQNPEATYWYEPLDAFYSNRLGIPTWTFPESMLYFNGALRRRVSREEQDSLSSFIASLFTCDTDAKLTELMAHSPSQHNQMRWQGDYMACYRTLVPGGQHYKTMRNCLQGDIRLLCSTLVKSEKNQCRTALIEARRQFHTNASSDTSPALAPFLSYVDCSQAIRKVVDTCAILMEDSCRQTHLRTAKVLRMHMKDVEGIIQKHSTLKVIHLIRDPRAIVLSRIKSNHSRFRANIFRSDALKQMAEAKYLCLKMYNDIMERRQLELKYPNVFLEVKYESIAANPIGYATKIYGHIHESLPESLTEWLHNATHADVDGNAFSTVRKSSSTTANAWKSDPLLEKRVIDALCEELLQAAGYEP